MQRSRFRPRPLAALAATLLACAATAWAADIATKTASEADLRSGLTRLHGVIAACQASARACDPAAVGDDLRLGDPEHGGYEVHWQALRDALEKARNLGDKDRSNLLRDSTAQLTRIEAELDANAPPDGQQSFAQAKSTAAGILAAPEFQRHEEQTWWDRLKARMIGWLLRLIDRVQSAGASAPWLGTLIEWLFFTGAAVGLLIFLLRSLNRQRLRVSMEGAAPIKTPWDREATDWAQLAEQHASAREWRDAVHCLYWAAIVSLESRRAWRHNPTRTPREYLRLLHPGSPQQRGLRGLTRIFERVWYGLREARQDEYSEARKLYEGLARGAAEADTAAIAEGGAA
jgi:hypothetical protein